MKIKLKFSFSLVAVFDTDSNIIRMFKVECFNVMPMGEGGEVNCNKEILLD